MSIVLARLVARGRVQGVFYRATVRDIARKMGITGYVRNLYDGGVEIVCECRDENQLREFRDAIYIQKNFGIYVNTLTIADKSDVESPQFKSFEIRY